MTKTKVKGSAPGQYLGFALQPVRLFHHLITCDPEESAGLEYVDDVSVHAHSHVRVAEQCKSALSGNPISNWAVDFWKTLANWVENIEAGHLDAEKTVFQLYVTPVKKAGFAEKLSETKSDKEIDTILEEIKKKRQKLGNTPECEPYLEKVLSSDPDALRSLLRNFVLINTDESPLTPIEAHLDATLRPEIMEAAIKHGIGDAKREVDALIRARQPAIIKAANFRKRFHAFISAHDPERFLQSFSDAPSEEAVGSTIAKAPVFVRQLDLVEADVETKTRATSDYLQATGDRTKWAESGVVFEGSMDDYDDALHRRHSNLKTELNITQKALNDVEKGLLLYTKCCATEQIPLEGRVVPLHFLPGSLNSLADRSEIGWHPDFKALLAKDKG